MNTFRNPEKGWRSNLSTKQCDFIYLTSTGGGHALFSAKLCCHHLQPFTPSNAERALIFLFMLWLKIPATRSRNFNFLWVTIESIFILHQKNFGHLTELLRGHHSCSGCYTNPGRQVCFVEILKRQRFDVFPPSFPTLHFISFFFRSHPYPQTHWSPETVTLENLAVKKMLAFFSSNYFGNIRETNK